MNVENLISIGGALWEKDSMRRVYFNNLAELAGLSCSYYGTGNISGASKDGEKISNSRARDISTALSMSKIWYDLEAKNFCGRMYDSRRVNGDKLYEEIVAEIERRASLQGDIA